MAFAPTTNAVQRRAMVDRESKLTIRISEEERDMLRAIADAEGVSASDVLRLYIRRVYREKFGDKPTKKPAKK